MSFLYRMEAKWGSKAVKNLPLIVAIIFAVNYVLAEFAPGFYEQLLLVPSAIYGKGQVWRLFTWIFTIPGYFDYFTLVMLFVYVMLGRSIEMAIGTLMYNVYIFSTLFAILIGNLIAGLVLFLQAGGWGMSGAELDAFISTESMVALLFPNWGPTIYLLEAIFLGFALIYSESFMLFMFVIPVKAKYLAYVDLIWLGYNFYKYGYVYNRVNIAMVVGIWLVLLLLFKNYKPGHAKVMLQRKAYTAKRTMERKKREREDEKSKIIEFPGGVARHRCAVCGKTEKDDPMMEFRFCSKCEGNYEYCSEHLYTHEHVKK